MSCSHAVSCPLFPLLRASLHGWRDYYCDSQDQWHTCARYKSSLAGERVPISLLPNGAVARHLETPAAAETARAGMQGAGVPGAGMQGAGRHGAGMQGAGMPGPGMQGAGMQGAGMPGPGMQGAGMHGAGVYGASNPGQASWQAPAQAPPSQPDPWAQGADPWAQQADASWSQPAMAGHHQPSSPTLTPQPGGRPARRARQAPSPKRGWWARLADWMRGPA